MDIKCRKTTCVFNNKFRCDSKAIDITKERICATCQKSDKVPKDTTKNLFYGKIEYAPYRNAKNIQINCKADCLFNHSGECYANGICVNDVSSKACCMTYLKK